MFCKPEGLQEYVYLFIKDGLEISLLAVLQHQSPVAGFLSASEEGNRFG